MEAWPLSLCSFHHGFEATHRGTIFRAAVGRWDNLVATRLHIFFNLERNHNIPLLLRCEKIKQRQSSDNARLPDIRPIEDRAEGKAPRQNYADVEVKDRHVVKSLMMMIILAIPRSARWRDRVKIGTDTSAVCTGT